MKDFDYIEISKEINQYSNNTVKLLNEKKNYYIKFELNHLIQLDKNFLDSEVTFTDKSGVKYILNNENKIINIKGKDFTVYSNKKALIYFYERIENYNDKSIFEFDKLKKGKNMKIIITNKNNYKLQIAIAKDFGFKNYYPMINSKYLEEITIPPKKSIDTYIENYYDMLEFDLYESKGEKYYIYLFEVKKDKNPVLLDKNKIEINSIIYFESITKLSKFNFDIIPKGKTNIILKKYNNKMDSNIDYQFIKCSNSSINFEFKTNNEKNIAQNKKEIINTNTFIRKKIEQPETLINSFESKDEFLFLYGFSDFNIFDPYYYVNSRDEKYETKYGIKYLYLSNKNILYIRFLPYYETFSEYYIIVARKDEINNLYSFYNPCHLTKLLKINSDKICIKKIYQFIQNADYEFLISEEIDISKIVKNKNDDYVINIISFNIENFYRFEIFSSVIFNKKEKNKKPIELKFCNKISLNPRKNYFTYNHLTDEKLIFSMKILKNKSDDELLFLTLKRDNEVIKTYTNQGEDLIEIIFEKKGKYSLEVYPYYDENIFFYFYPFNSRIEEIDLTKKYYSGFAFKNNSAYYKVNNLKEDKLVYFTFGFDWIDYDKSLFTICEKKNNECITNVYSYNFLKGKEYIIYFNFKEYLKKLWSITIIDYNFFPIFENTIQNNIKEGHYIINSPKIFIIENNNGLYFDVFNARPYFIPSDGSFKKNNLPRINEKYYLDPIKIYSFYLEKNSKYRTIIFIPEENDKLKQIFITNTRIEDSNDFNQIEVKAGKNALIYFDEREEYPYNYYSIKKIIYYFQIFSSPVNNIKFVSNEKEFKNGKNFFNHYGKIYLYIDKCEKDIYIEKNIYYLFNYAFFSILNDKTIYHFKNYINEMKFYSNKRINTDHLYKNDFINLYVDYFDATYNLYIKKYYGPIQIYESDYFLNDYSNLKVLTKPINGLRNKKSIFNRLIKINKNRIITGYLSENSLIDIYLEKDNNDKDIYYSEFKNRKYLKKGIEYQIHFKLYHLIKLETQFNAEIIIYNEDTKIILNDKNETGIVIGNNFKIKANNDAMVYFYPKTKKFQKRLEPKNGEIIEIKSRIHRIDKYSIDLGFEGFEPPDMEYYSTYENQLYVENIYDKLDYKLAKGEYLFIYYEYNREDAIEINYLNDFIINSGNKYNFNLVKQNMINKKYIIKNFDKKKLIIQINQCISSSPYKIWIHGDDINYNFNKSFFYDYGKVVKIYNPSIYSGDKEVSTFLLQSNNNFVLSYLYKDEKDEDLSLNKYLKNHRLQLDNLTINNITVKNENRININFNTNYKYSLTKYIIIITPEEKNNTFENLKDFCFLTELIYKKDENFITEEFYDIGENKVIDYEIDIPKFKCKNKRCIINIISQEFIYEKYLRFYKPKFFIIEKKEFLYTTQTIIIIIGFAFILILSYFYFKKSNNFKINKKLKMKMNEELFGTELDDSSNFINNENN